MLPAKYLCNCSEKSLLGTQGRLDMVATEKTLSILIIFNYFYFISSTLRLIQAIWNPTIQLCENWIKKDVKKALVAHLKVIS